jgi:hypothetical protein
MPGPIRRPGDGHTKYVQPATSTTGGGVAPGSVKSPVPSLTLPGSKNVKVGGMHIGTIHVAALRSFLIHKGYHLPEEGGFGPRLKAALADFVNPKQVGGPLAAAPKLGTSCTGPRRGIARRYSDLSPALVVYSTATATTRRTPAATDRSTYRASMGCRPRTCSRHCRLRWPRSSLT